MSRVVGRLRLSRSTEESTSIERQKELITQWCELHGHVVVGWATDIDVSGSVDPFETKGLGAWLTEDALAKYDIMAAWKLDRYGRRVIPLNKLFGWFLDHNKTLVCISDQIDLSTWIGRLVANVLAGVAEGELEAIKERTVASRAKLLKIGRWPGGTPPYWLEKYKVDAGYKLRLIPARAQAIVSAIEDVIAGANVAEAAENLQQSGVPTAKGGPWDSVTLWQIFTNRLLLGHATYKGETVRDENGEPVLVAEPLITQDTWNRLQKALEQRKNPNNKRTRDTSRLLGVLKCMTCGANYSIRQHSKHGRVYRYYWCRGDHPGQNQINADMIEKLLEENFLSEIGHEELEEKVYVPASDHMGDLRAAQEAVEELSAMMVGAKSKGAREQLAKQISALDSKIAVLEELPVQEEGYIYKSTGKTWQQVWDESNWQERRKALVKSGIVAEVRLTGNTRSKNSSGALEFKLIVPIDIKERMTR